MHKRFPSVSRTFHICKLNEPPSGSMVIQRLSGLIHPPTNASLSRKLPVEFTSTLRMRARMWARACVRSRTGTTRFYDRTFVSPPSNSPEERGGDLAAPIRRHISGSTLNFASHSANSRLLPRINFGATAHVSSALVKKFSADSVRRISSANIGLILINTILILRSALPLFS